MWEELSVYFQILVFDHISSTSYLYCVKEVLLFSAFCDAGYTHIKFSVCSKISYLICFCKNSRFTISNQ